jgi:PAS domain S-box-containing protein
MLSKSVSMEGLLKENVELRERLDEAEETLAAIRNGEVDALIIQSVSGPQVYSLEGQEAETNRFRGEMLAQVGDAVIAVDDEERVIYLNSAAERLYDFTASDALGQPLSKIYHSCWLLPSDETKARTALRERGEWRGEYVHIKCDGQKINVESGLTMLQNLAGETTGMLAVIRDVSQRTRHENKLLISEIRYRRLFEAARDGILILDPGTRKIIDANPFMVQMLGYSHRELVGKELFEVGMLKDAAETREMLRNLEGGAQVRYENVSIVDRRGGRQEVEVVANLYDENGRPVIQCSIRDVTERRRSEEHVKLLMAEVNHRARNLLAVVQAVAHQTSRHGDPSTLSKRLSDRIGGLAVGQDLLVKNQWQGVEVADLVEAQLAHFRELFGTRLLIEGPPAQLRPEAAQGIGMALHELTTNAVKYGALSNSKGEVHIIWEVTADANPSFSMSWSEHDGPKVETPVRKGFGQIVIGRMSEAAVQGVAEMHYAEDGFSWKLTAPSSNALML